MVKMEIDHLFIVHPVKVIPCQNECILRACYLDFCQLFTNGISCALIPIGAFGGLLGGKNLYPTSVKSVEIIGAGDMPMERDRIELCQHSDPINAGINTIAQGCVDQPV